MAEMPRQLTQAEIDRILFNQRMGMQPTPPSIQNLRQGISGTVTSIPDNFFNVPLLALRLLVSLLIRLALRLTLPNYFPVIRVRAK